jgi:hypothetical protein
MDVTEAELRSAGKTIAEIVLRRMDGMSEDEKEIERGAFAEMLLALGISEELTVRGAAAQRRWLENLEETWPGSYAQKMTA